MHDLVWDDLRYFLAAHRAGSFSRAASVLGTRQSTVSRRIAALERALGGALFHRSRVGLVPSALAAAVLEEAEAAEAATRRVRVRVDDLHGTVSGVVRIAVAPGLASHWLTPRLPSLRARHPDLRFDIVVATSIADLTRREADLALRFVRPQGADLVARRLTALEHAVLADRRWVGAPWDDLDWVALDVPGLATDEALWTARHAARPPVLRTTDWEVAHAAVRAGLGAIVTYRGLAHQVFGLVALDTPAPLPEACPLWLVAHRATRMLPRVDALWRTLVDWSDDLQTTAAPASQ